MISIVDVMRMQSKQYHFSEVPSSIVIASEKADEDTDEVGITLSAYDKDCYTYEG